MSLLAAGLILFLGTHGLAMVAPQWRDACAARSPLLSKAGYAALSLLGLVWMVQGHGQARLAPWPLYVLPVGVHHLTALLMLLPVFLLLLAAYLPGRIKTATRHPMLLAAQ